MKKILTLALLALSMMLISCDKEECMCELYDGPVIPSNPNDTTSVVPNNPIDPNNPDTTIVVPPIPDITKSLVGTSWVTPNYATGFYIGEAYKLEFLNETQYRVSYKYLKEGNGLSSDIIEVILPTELYEYDYPEITLTNQWDSKGLALTKPTTRKTRLSNDNKSFQWGYQQYLAGDEIVTLETP